MGHVIFCKIFGFFIVTMVNYAYTEDEVCDRTPLGIKVAPLRPDNQFILEVEKIKEDKYIPGNTYTVKLHSTNEKSKFIAFTISLKEDSMHNVDNPRKPLPLQAGHLEPFPNSSSAISSPNCLNTIIQSDVIPKSDIKVLWHAPGKENKCVSIFAVVAVSPRVWYNFEPPLSLKVCEDPRKSEDLPPTLLNGDCDTCEDARYKLTFEGLWTYNTHSDMFPSAKELAQFSDLVGASHSPETSLFRYASEASIGIKMLAEQGNTTQFEIETQKKMPTLVRTVIKASRPAYTDLSTVTSFRATPHFHRLSMAIGILPSPDWFLGITQLELCDEKSRSWSRNIMLNLYPIDAGTDKGQDFESSNEEQSPPQPIGPLEKIGKDQLKPDKPFARIHVQLVRTYIMPQCLQEEVVTQAEVTDINKEEEGGVTEEPKENRQSRPSHVTQRTTTTTTTSEEPQLELNPDSSESCPMTNWEDWQACAGICTNGILKGIQTRFRYHIVDSVIVKNIEHRSHVPQFCLDNYPDIKSQLCVDSCKDNQREDDETQEEAGAEASRRTWQYYKG